MTVYDFKVYITESNEISLEQYRGKVLLIVNTASQCGFTPQYAQLQELYLKYKEKGLEILAFPCNQFGQQEKGDDAAIKKFCDLKFNITFPLFSKIEVNGDDAHPLFVYLKQEQRGFLGSKAIKWNFTKFLVDREGKPVSRFAPKTKPLDFEDKILQLIG